MINKNMIQNITNPDLNIDIIYVNLQWIMIKPHQYWMIFQKSILKDCVGFYYIIIKDVLAGHGNFSSQYFLYFFFWPGRDWVQARALGPNLRAGGVLWAQLPGPEKIGRLVCVKIIFANLLYLLTSIIRIEFFSKNATLCKNINFSTHSSDWLYSLLFPTRLKCFRRA